MSGPTWRAQPPAVLDSADLFPVCEARIDALLLAKAAVYRQDRAAGILQHLCVRDSPLDGGEDANLARHGNLEAAVERADDIANQIPLVLQKRAVVAALGDVLRAPEVDVHGVALVFDQLGGRQHRLRIVTAKLDKQRPVLRRRRELACAVLVRLHKDARVEHGRVRKLRAVAAREQPPGQLRAIHHGSDDIPGKRPRQRRAAFARH